MSDLVRPLVRTLCPKACPKTLSEDLVRAAALSERQIHRKRSPPCPAACPSLVRRLSDACTSSDWPPAHFEPCGVTFIQPCPAGLYVSFVHRLYGGLSNVCLDKPWTSHSVAEVACPTICTRGAILRRWLVRGLYGFFVMGFFIDEIQ